MRRMLLCVTISLDGFLADVHGGVDWLLPPPRDGLPEDYLALMEQVDTLVMGRATYETSLALEGGLEVFKGKEVYVLTSRRDLPPCEGVTRVGEAAVDFVERLKASQGGLIWLFGGGLLASALLEAGLVDDLLIAVQPILLGEGIPLWHRLSRRQKLETVLTRQWPGGILELRYRRGD